MNDWLFFDIEDPSLCKEDFIPEFSELKRYYTFNRQIKYNQGKWVDVD